MPAIKASIQPGATFRSTHADSNALWKVLKPRGRDTYDCVIIDNPDYEGTKKVFGGEEIRRHQNMDAFWAQSRAKHVGWWDARTVGEIVHYHNGFGEFIRGEIVEVEGKKQMQSRALVGAWSATDLPRRMLNGDVDEGLQARHIREGHVMQPNESNMYESPEFSRRASTPDPRQMEPINLTVGPSTPAEDRALEADTLRQQVLALLSERPQVDNSADYAREIESRLARANELISQHRYAGYQRGVQEKLADATAALATIGKKD